MRESLRQRFGDTACPAGQCNAQYQVTEKEIDNFMATDEGLAMTSREYRVVQALLPVNR